jgi:putative peptide zinc metalloprotease protein
VTTAVSRPRLRPEVTLGPGLRCGPRTVHRVRDRLTGCSYRVGAREHFVLAMMDGEHTMDDIGHAYAEVFGKVLGPDSRGQIFAMLGRTQLLDGYADPTALDRLRTAREDREARRTGSGTWYRRRWVLSRPDRLCGRLARALALVFHPAAVATCLLISLAGQVYVWTHFAALTQDTAHRPPWPVTVPLFLLLAWALTAVHELAHGVACRHFGGQVSEIGVRWRLPLLVPYCRTDDVMLFPARSARVGTAYAGCHAVLVLVAPLVAVWALLPHGGPSSATLATVILFGSGGSHIALLPFLGLDGQAILEHATGRTELGRQTWRFWTGRESRGDYRRSDAAVHAGYGAAACAALVAGYALLMQLWYDTLRNWVGPVPAFAILVAESAAALTVAVLLVRHRTGTRRKAPDGR